MGLSNLERLWEDVNAVPHYLKWWQWWAFFRENRFFSEVHKERTSGAVIG